MLTANMLKEYAYSLGIPACGICSAEDDRNLLTLLQKRKSLFSTTTFEEEDAEKRAFPRRLMPEAKSIFVCLFPYYMQDLQTKNISRYAAVKDYHKVIEGYLNTIGGFVREKVPGSRVKILCDTTAAVDRHLAYKAGLGFFGKNNTLIHKKFGSYFFIGSLLLSVDLAIDTPLTETCLGCNACINACPGKALLEDYGFRAENCVSYITQKKEMTQEQAKILQGQASVYGCDVCQNVCPHNQNLPDTPIAELYEGKVLELSQEELTALSGREFKKKYQDYAFSWCGKQAILKNFRKNHKG